MNNYSKKELISKLNQVIYCNSNPLTFEQCYGICANKGKLDELLRRENQVVFGRRGTGKTTLFKAFAYYVNSVKRKSNNNVCCWYTRLDNNIPAGVEIKNDNIDNIVFFCIKNFLSKFIKFLYEEYDVIEKNKKCNNRDREMLAEILFALSDIVENGSETINEITATQSVSNTTSSDTNTNIGFSTPTKTKFHLYDIFNLGFTKNRKRNKVITTTQEKKFVYRIDINEIKTYIDEFMRLAKYSCFYICIDEFSLVDRDIPFTIQPAVAQIIKELFFDSSIIVVKISSIWNESRMQNRQLGGNREGLELGQDIFSNEDLNLDIMFKYNSELAIEFFKEYLCNAITQYESITKNERQKLPDYIVDTLFSQNSFRHLVCGSQGVPRIFCSLLLDCLKMLTNEKSSKISVLIVFRSIMKNYLHDVRQSIPIESDICKAIEDYVSKTHCRFFIINSKEYNDAVHFIDGLVSNHALHQCPSDQLPREIRNTCKLFFVHYGNYLDSFNNGQAKLDKDSALLNNGHLFPKLPSDIVSNADKYTLRITADMLDTLYCTYCHKYFNKSNFIEHNNTTSCPMCGKEIAHWY